MNSDLPDFYLASNDSMSFRGPRHCWIQGTVVGDLRNDYLLVRVDPPAKDYKTNEMIEQIIIAGRDRPTDTSKLPLNVYIAKITDTRVVELKQCSADDIKVVATGDIYRTEDEAAESLDAIGTDRRHR